MDATNSSETLVKISQTTRYLNPKTTRYLNPKTTRYLNPKTTRYLNPKTTRCLNPKTTRYLNPKTTRCLNSKTNRYLNPKTTRYLNPKTTRYLNPKTTRYLNPKTRKITYFVAVSYPRSICICLLPSSTRFLFAPFMCLLSADLFVFVSVFRDNHQPLRSFLTSHEATGMTCHLTSVLSL
jgi:hypothetical protein